MTYPDTEARLRTDLPFDELSDEENHLGPSPVSATGIGMLCLGIVRKLILILRWMKGPPCRHMSQLNSA